MCKYLYPENPHEVDFQKRWLRTKVNGSSNLNPKYILEHNRCEKASTVKGVPADKSHRNWQRENHIWANEPGGRDVSICIEGMSADIR
ncbi:hypothetical protein YC2023_019620 [Brassica napus]